MTDRAATTIARLLTHRSIRRFAPDPVPEEVLARWIEAGQAASTSSHVQAYAAIRVSDPETRARLAELTGGQRQVAEAGVFLVICSDSRRHQLVCSRAGDPCVENFESFLVAAIDASLFAQNLVVAAESEGAGICYIGGLRTELAAVDALLELPSGVYPLFGLCLGTPAEDPDVKPRLPIEEVLYEERVPEDATTLEQIDLYDTVMGEHYAARGLSGRNWSGGVRRKRGKPHRIELPDYYASKGASLDGAGSAETKNGNAEQ